MVEVKVLDDDCDRQKMDIRMILQEKDRLDRDVEVFRPYSLLSHPPLHSRTRHITPSTTTSIALFDTLSHMPSLSPLEHVFSSHRYPISDTIPP